MSGDSRSHPFAHQVDPSVFFRSAKHDSACAELVAAAKTHTGLLVLSGESGTGKTAVLECVARVLEQAGRRLLRFSIVRPLHEMFPPPWGQSWLAAFRARVHAAGATLVAVDDAQGLRPNELELLGELVDSERSTGRQFAVLLVGQPGLDVTLAGLEGSRAERAVALRVKLTPLDTSDVRAYIAHRLLHTGLRLDDVFEGEAVGRVAEYAEGLPRNINYLCYAALHAATDSGLTMVSAFHVEVAAGWLELDVPRSGGGTAQPRTRTRLREVASAGDIWEASTRGLGVSLMPATRRIWRALASAAARPWGRRWSTHVRLFAAGRDVGRLLANCARVVASTSARLSAPAWGTRVSGTAGRAADRRADASVAGRHASAPAKIWAWSPHAGLAALVLAVCTLVLVLWPIADQPPQAPTPERLPPIDRDVSRDRPPDSGRKTTARVNLPSNARHRGPSPSPGPATHAPVPVTTMHPMSDR